MSLEQYKDANRKELWEILQIQVERIAELEAIIRGRDELINNAVSSRIAELENALKDSMLTLGGKIAELEKAADTKAITMAYGFAGLISSLKEPITFSEKHWATPAADIAAGLILSNNLKGDCDFDNFVYFNYEQALKEQGDD